jgi:hypothetical protein
MVGWEAASPRGPSRAGQGGRRGCFEVLATGIGSIVALVGQVASPFACWKPSKATPTWPFPSLISQTDD